MVIAIIIILILSILLITSVAVNLKLIYTNKELSKDYNLREAQDSEKLMELTRKNLDRLQEISNLNKEIRELKEVSKPILDSITYNPPNFKQENLISLIKEISPYIRDGQKLQATKITKERTGWGLRESKDFVDNIVLPPNTDETSENPYQKITEIPNSTQVDRPSLKEEESKVDRPVVDEDEEDRKIAEEYYKSVQRSSDFAGK